MKSLIRPLLIALSLTLLFGCSSQENGTDTTDSSVQDVPETVLDATVDVDSVDTPPALDATGKDSFDQEIAIDVPPPLPPGSITGRLVNVEGQPLSGFGVLCCSLSLCYSGETDADGVYSFVDAEPGPRKMATHDPNNEYADMLFHQVVVSEQQRDLGEDVIIPKISEPKLPWTEEEGGTVILADGKLELTAAPQTLDYPFGIFDHEVHGVFVPGGQIPPFDIRPWEGLEDRSMLFMINPGHIKAEPGISLRVLSGVIEPEGTVFRIYTIEPDETYLIDAGTATVDADGILVSDESAQITQLSGFIIVPEGSLDP